MTSPRRVRALAVVAAAALVFLAGGGAARAQAGVEGKWWKRPRIAAELQLSADQVDQLEKIFGRVKPKLIDMRADLEKKQFEYDQAMSAEKSDRKNVESLIEAREQARSVLQKELALMELDMKQVLRPDQREKLARMRENAKQLMQQRRRRLRDESSADDPDAPTPKPRPR